MPEDKNRKRRLCEYKGPLLTLMIFLLFPFKSKVYTKYKNRCLISSIANFAANKQLSIPQKKSECEAVNNEHKTNGKLDSSHTVYLF